MIDNKTKALIVKKFLKGELRFAKKQFRETRKGDGDNHAMAMIIHVIDKWISLLDEHKGTYYFD